MDRYQMMWWLSEIQSSVHTLRGCVNETPHIRFFKHMGPEDCLELYETLEKMKLTLRDSPSELWPTKRGSE